ncbi:MULTISPECIES: hypothetical protein [unclassified Motilimonas]|uniref:hypothetical protein n=1 Tax=Motilimonas TaxID=1914248 RepID=UPI001E39BD94|nr:MULTISPECIES: hypothetical protein [unclassified Motilimonas]MCE0555806.1 hypothetical protein [Motilimonas sp. E26]MDO6524145.1 hypothetical protein [Motilimonas sp. 1_MG-2023]
MKNKEVLEQLLRGFGFKELMIAIMLLLVSCFIYFSQQQQSAINETSFALSANLFAQTSAEVHLQWLREGKPKQLNWRSKTVFVNSHGWPESIAANKNGLNCALLWQGLLDTDMLINNEPIQVKVLGDINGRDSGCLYYLPEQSGFEYWAKTGLIKQRLIDKTL